MRFSFAFLNTLLLGFILREDVFVNQCLGGGPYLFRSEKAVCLRSLEVVDRRRNVAYELC